MTGISEVTEKTIVPAGTPKVAEIPATLATSVFLSYYGYYEWMAERIQTACGCLSKAVTEKLLCMDATDLDMLQKAKRAGRAQVQTIDPLHGSHSSLIEPGCRISVDTGA